MMAPFPLFCEHQEIRVIESPRVTPRYPGPETIKKDMLVEDEGTEPSLASLYSTFYSSASDV